MSTPNPNGPSYAELAAKTMHIQPSFAAAEDVIKKDYPLKLPSRRFIQLWNTPELSQFRGIQQELDAAEENREQHAREKLEIKQAVREGGSGSVPEMDMVHEMLSHQRRQQGAMEAHMAGLNEIHRQQMEGMRAEQRAELQRFATAQMEAANRASIAEQALAGMRDVTLEHRNMIGKLAEQQGVVQQHIVNSNDHCPPPERGSGGAQQGHGHAAHARGAVWAVHAPAEPECRADAAAAVHALDAAAAAARHSHHAAAWQWWRDCAVCRRRRRSSTAASGGRQRDQGQEAAGKEREGTEANQHHLRDWPTSSCPSSPSARTGASAFDPGSRAAL